MSNPFDTAYEPPWMAIARHELCCGVAEVRGPGHNPRVAEYLGSVGIGPDDDVPWCSAFVNWVLEQVGIRGTGLGNARSWVHWAGGTTIARPIRGCISVFWRDSIASGKGHVGFYAGTSTRPGCVLLLGGNQLNQVCFKNYRLDRLLGYRWPLGVRQPDILREPCEVCDLQLVDLGPAD